MFPKNVSPSGRFLSACLPFLFLRFLMADTTLVLQDLPQPENLPIIPWLADSASPWTDGPPTFTLNAEASQTSAKGWVAISSEHLLVHVEVSDPQHINDKTAANLWDGDSLQLAIDGLGDGSRGMDPQTRGPMDKDDLALGLALTGKGAEGWMFFRHRSLDRSGPLPEGSFDVSRDGDRTLYTLRLPWKVLDMTPGISPHLGFAIQLNNNSPGISEQSRGFFGAGADGIPRPGLHQRLALGPPPGPVATARILNNVVWNASRPALLQLGLRGSSTLTLSARMGETEITRHLPPGELHHLQLRAAPREDAAELHVSVVDADAATVLELRESLVAPETVLFRLLGQIDSRLASAPHPLFARHLQSIRSLVLTEWARLGLYLEDNPQMAESTLERIRGIELGLQGDSGEWEAYLDGRRSLVMAYNSPHDSTLQYYMLNLPRDWDPEKTYPLFFELHGAGDSNPISLLASRLALDIEAPQLHGYDSPKTFAEIQRNGFHVHPWGRGNLGYRGISEIDILEAYDHAHRLLKIDENRRYLYGFSMGGGGTWSLGLRTPDRWAAIAILAGSSRRDPPGIGIAENATNLPVWIWCGEEDRLFPDMQRMVAELKSFGLEPVVSSTPQLGHTYIMAKQEEALNWLQQFTRKRPDRFSFRADTDSHTGARGIQMQRNPAISGLPRFTCEIAGQTVRIDSEGAPSLTLRPGKDGLGLDGDIVLVWNGKTVYEGPAVPLRLLDGRAEILAR
jgi:predicted esterase